MLLLIASAVVGTCLLQGDGAPSIPQDSRTAKATATPRDEGPAPPLSDPRSPTAASGGAPGPSEASREDASQPMLRGRVTQNGQPLADHVVEEWAGEYAQTQPTGAHATTAADGSFAIPVAAGPSSRWLRVRGPRAPYDWMHGCTQLEVGTLVVPAPAKLTVRVIDENGEPLPRTTVAAHAGGGRLEPHDLSAAREELVAQTDGEGRVTFERVLPGRVQVAAQGHERIPMTRYAETESGKTANVEIALQPGHAVEGQVFDWRGEPVPNAVVFSYSYREPVTTTDDQGRFRVTGMYPKGILWIDAGDRGGEARIDVEGRDRLRVDLARAYRLTVAVRGAEGRRAVVHVRSPEYEAAGRNPRHAPIWMQRRCAEPFEVPAGGTLELRGVAPAIYRIEAVVPGFARSAVRALSLTGDTEITLDVQALPTCSVRLVANDGEPVAGARVYWPADAREIARRYSREGTQSVVGALNGEMVASEEAFTDDQGRVTVAFQRDQPLVLCVQVEGYRWAYEGFDAHAAPREHEFVLQRLGELRGTLACDDLDAVSRSVEFWAPEEDAEVRAGRARPRMWSRVDGGGAFATKPPEGRWCLGLRYRNLVTLGRPETHRGPGVPFLEGPSVPLDRTVDIRAGQPLEVALLEPPLGALHGRVLVANQPLANARLTLQRRQAPGGGRVADERELFDYAPGLVTADDGEFRFFYSQGGRVELLVGHPDGGELLSHVFELPPPTASGAVRRDVHLPGGAIRGRFDAAAPPEDLRGTVRVRLYPWAMVAEEPHGGHDHNWRLPTMASRRAERTLDEHGAFRFGLLPAGDYLVRVSVQPTPRDHGVLLVCDARATVQNGTFDLGTLTPDVVGPVSITVQGSSEVDVPGHLILHRVTPEHPEGIWVASFAFRRRDEAGRGTAEFAYLPPGRYRVTPKASPFARLRGEPKPAAAFDVEITAEGQVVPDVVSLEPAK